MKHRLLILTLIIFLTGFTYPGAYIDPTRTDKLDTFLHRLASLLKQYGVPIV